MSEGNTESEESAQSTVSDYVKKLEKNVQEDAISNALTGDKSDIPGVKEGRSLRGKSTKGFGGWQRANKDYEGR